MATVHVTLFTVSARASDKSQVVGVPQSVPASVATATSSGTSAQASLTGQRGQVWSVTSSGGNVWVAFGANPTAASGSGWYMLNGQTREFSVCGDNEKIAIKDAP